MVIRTLTRAGARDTLPEGLYGVLPDDLTCELSVLCQVHLLEEVRIRRGRRATAVTSTGNVMLNYIADQNEINEIMTRMCRGALYAYSDTINQGYISLPDGIRVGVGGRASCDGDKIIGIYDISSLCVRIPHRQRRVGDEVCDLLRSLGGSSGVLIYSAPGVGKTTLLRGCVSILASAPAPLRTVVIDTRGELGFSLEGDDLCLDVLSGYPRRIGIEIATRSMNAQLIVCDEIGDYGEAISLISSHNCGVPLIASAHAGSTGELLSRPGIRLLHDAGIFGAYVGISRAPHMNFSYHVVMRNEIKQ